MTTKWPTNLSKRKITDRTTYISQADVLDESGVDVGTLPGLLQDGIDKVLQAGVLEATLAALGERGADRKRDDDVVGILGGPVKAVKVRWLFCQKFCLRKVRGCCCVAACGTWGKGNQLPAKTYKFDRALLGDRCLRMDPSLSTAIVKVVCVNGYWCGMRRK